MAAGWKVFLGSQQQVPAALVGSRLAGDGTAEVEPPLVAPPPDEVNGFGYADGWVAPPAAAPAGGAKGFGYAAGWEVDAAPPAPPAWEVNGFGYADD